jgi:hypothetical protein
LNPLWVAGVGLIAPGLESWSAAQPVLTAAVPWCASEAALPAPAMLPKNERRRASPTIRLALGAAQQAIDAAGVAPGELAAFFGSSSGDGDVLHALLEMVTGPEGRASPTLFHNSVHNAAAGYWSIATGAQAPSLSIGAFDATAAATLMSAAVGTHDRVAVVCLYDAALPEPLRAARAITLPFGAALVLSPTPTPGALARLALRLGAPATPPTPLRAASLAPLLAANPSARVLPLLEALAGRRAGEVVLPWEDAPPLAITVTPC